MKIASAAFLLAALLLTSCGHHKYRLKGNIDKVGDARRHELKLTMGEIAGSVDGPQGHMDVHMNMDGNVVKTIRIVTVGDGGASVEEVVYEKDLQTTKIDLNGQKDSEDNKSPLEGTTLTARRAGDKWTEALKDGTPTPVQERRLKKDYVERADFYPDRELTVGETWSVPADAVSSIFGGKLKSLEGTMACKFERTEEFAGQECAVITVDINASGLDSDRGGKQKMTMTLHGTIHRSLKRFLDLKTELAGTMKTEPASPDAAPKFLMAGPIKAELTISPL